MFRLWPRPLKIFQYKKFYMQGFIPLIFFSFLFLLSNLNPFHFLFFFVAYCWHFSLRSPGLHKRAKTLAYRLTFIRFIYAIDIFFSTRPLCQKYHLMKLTCRGLAPFAFNTVIFFLTGDGNPLYSLLGSFLFEVIFRKYNPLV